MKRITIAAATALMLAGPLATTASAQNYVRGNRGDQNDNRDRNDHRGDRNDNQRGRGDNASDRNGRNHRDNNRWDNQRNNGYSYNGRWYYGPPQAAHARAYQPGYRAWRRGDRLPSYYQNSYRQVDYRREHLRAPPRGYRYVQDDRGEYLLVGIATGVILSILLSQ
jgi:Ni/Co efflux regulator RcnB